MKSKSAKKPLFICKEHNLEIGNIEHEGQSRGALVRHLTGKKPDGHGLSQDESYRQIDNYRIKTSRYKAREPVDRYRHK